MEGEMKKTEERILADACSKAGAASYLFVTETQKMERQGLLVRDGEFKFRATEKGRRVFLRKEVLA